MDDNRLSEMYAMSCARLQQAASELYEDLHTKQGSPKTDVPEVIEMITAYKRWLVIEADLIRELAKEYGDKDGGQSKQT